MSLRHPVGIGLLGITIVAVAPPLGAQAVRGVVAVVNTDERLRGSSVSLAVPNGRTVAETLSGEYGEFLLQAAQPGVYALCAALLMWTTTPPEYGRPTVFAVGVARSPGWGRDALEFAWRATQIRS